MTWTASGTPTTKTWTAQAASSVPWEQLREENDATDGVDFVLLASEQRPNLCSADLWRCPQAFDNPITSP